MIFPVKAPHKITQKFSKNHLGIDIAPIIPGTKGVPCLAPEASTVYRSAYNASPEGHYVILKGKSGVYYYFGHFERRLVNTGESVKEGQAIGVLGKTGLADGIHTHHEVRPFGPGPGKSIDPEKYYKDNEGEPMSTWNNGDTYNFLYSTVDKATADKAKKANYVGYFGNEAGKESKVAVYTIMQSAQYQQMKKAAQPAPPSTDKEYVLQYIEKNLK